MDDRFTSPFGIEIHRARFLRVCRRRWLSRRIEFDGERSPPIRRTVTSDDRLREEGHFRRGAREREPTTGSYMAGERTASKSVTGGIRQQILIKRASSRVSARF